MTIKNDVYVDLSSADDGEWFQFFTSHIDVNTGEVVYDDPIDGGPRIQIRDMRTFIRERIKERKMQVDNVVNPKTRSMERIRYPKELSAQEEKQEREDLIDYMVVNFEGFKDKKTKTFIENTRENKIKMMDLPIFDRCVSSCQQKLSDSSIQEAVAEQKN